MLPRIAFARTRRRHQGGLGLRLGVVVLAVTTVALLFVALAQLVTAGDAITAFDREVAAWLHVHASPALKRAMRAVSAAHAPRAILAMTALVALALLWRRDMLALATVLITVLGGATLNHVLKHSVQRARPIFDNVLAGATDFSFPSGHVANATLLYGVATALIVCHLRTWPARLAVALCAALLVASVGFSRIVLGAHYLSDVLAGVVVGLTWLALCLIAMNPCRRAKRAGSREAG